MVLLAWPLIVLLYSLVILACPLVVLVVLSVGLFITNRLIKCLKKNHRAEIQNHTYKYL